MIRRIASQETLLLYAEFVISKQIKIVGGIKLGIKRYYLGDITFKLKES